MPRRPLIVSTVAAACVLVGGGWFWVKPAVTSWTSVTVAARVRQLRGLSNESLAARSAMLRVVRELNEFPDAPLSGRQLQQLKLGSAQYLALRDDLYHLAKAGEGLLDLSPKDLARLGLSPYDRLKAVMVAVSSALTLYDNYFLAVVVFQEDLRLRQLLNDPDSGFGIEANRLAKITLSAYSASNRRRVRSALRFYEKEKERLAVDAGVGPRLRHDADSAYLTRLIEGSPSYALVRNVHLATSLQGHMTFLERVSVDALGEIKGDSTNLVSMLFGNTVGLYEARKGKLYRKPAIEATLAAQLRPLDLLLERTPFRLTDAFIPGHFGHVAIWLGTESELRALGLWDHPVVVPYRETMRAGATEADKAHGCLIVEALRDGVQLSRLSDFLNVDDVAILRPVALAPDREAVCESLVMALRQVGKKYDFGFDVNTTEKIVCSELVYTAIPGIEWPTSKALGRYTISPDQVAVLARRGYPLQIVDFYHDGVPVPRDQQLTTMLSLMGIE